ncbi:hypothetical protein A4A49_64874 [Nicotiana attenuata]|uniref:RNase H type-1 domain-containing protein n=1 Tax=Nicotiana attenuata TaxID=49451 RepID=A0A1J6KT64_NICAT|nr:hypothetical protein A4A49_64874 [Nicotiana attenuata]
MECRYLLHQLGNPPITHIYREQNYAAHYLAQQGSITQPQHCITVITQPPDFLLSQLLADQEGTLYRRLVKPYNTTDLIYIPHTLPNDQPLGQHFENHFCNSVPIAPCNITT